MSRLGAEPRVNAKTLGQHVGQTVRLTAKVLQLSGDKATVESSDGQKVGIHLSRDMHLSDGYVEIIGTVKDDNTIKALTNIDLGNSLDMKAVDHIVEFAHSSKGEGVLS
ncbi:hypothetical protein JCM24511_04364 [Saitozyma sp. JCM 24511]|uniref:Replication factor A protein 3 n=1 Tax=Saitozyma podzolica TaxID=1890683 RepID=A0A427YLH7_9TREE|nr:hypothetical protein EHS25_009349 [Saitozyma podzolica]GFZ46118.1 hypothetical protein JCM24511_04364 [Saitozyma sp. JCM 24511]